MQPNPYQTYGPDDVEGGEEDPYAGYGTHHSYYQPNYPEPRPVGPEEPIAVVDIEEELRSPGIQRLTRSTEEQEQHRETRTSAHFWHTSTNTDYNPVIKPSDTKWRHI